MEAETSPDLPSANWTPREDGVLPVQVKRPQDPEEQMTVSVPEQKNSVPAQTGRENPPFLRLFVLFRPSQIG